MCNDYCKSYEKWGLTACEGCAGRVEPPQEEDESKVSVRDNGDGTASFVGPLVGMGF
ncbi:MAG: hypothetical protein PVG39_24190 [Desulfobacteraceae bacterium]|jgi:hypothetical protein